MFKVNDKIKDAFSAFLGALLLLLFAGGSGWMAFIMFQRGSWLIGAIGVIGALFFSSPLWAGLFITKKEPEPEPVVTKVDWPTDKAALLKLAQTVAGDDAEVMQLVKDSLASPEAFYAARSEPEGEYADEYYEMLDTYKDKPDTLRSEGLLVLLEELRVIVRFDWKADLDSFQGMMPRLKRVQRYGLNLSDAPLDEAAYVPRWCEALDKFWKPKHYHTLLIDTQSDEYVVAVAPNRSSSSKTKASAKNQAPKSKTKN